MIRRRPSKLLPGGSLPPDPTADQVDQLLELWARGVLHPAVVPGDRDGCSFDDIRVAAGGGRSVGLARLNALLERYMATATPECLSVLAEGSSVPIEGELQRSLAPALVAMEAAVLLARKEDRSLERTSARWVLRESASLGEGPRELLKLAGAQRSLAFARAAEERAATLAPDPEDRPDRFVRNGVSPLVVLHDEAFRGARDRALKVPGSVVRFGSSYAVGVLAYDRATDRVRIQEHDGSRQERAPREVSLQDLQGELDAYASRVGNDFSRVMSRSVSMGTVGAQPRSATRRTGRADHLRRPGLGGTSMM